MRIKTMVILAVAILLVIVIFQNTGQVKFVFLFADFYMSKLVMMLLVTAVGFVLGYLTVRPKNIRRLGGGTLGDENTSTLSAEDKAYVE